MHLPIPISAMGLPCDFWINKQNCMGKGKGRWGEECSMSSLSAVRSWHPTRNRTAIALGFFIWMWVLHIWKTYFQRSSLWGAQSILPQMEVWSAEDWTARSTWLRLSVSIQFLQVLPGNFLFHICFNFQQQSKMKKEIWSPRGALVHSLQFPSKFQTPNWLSLYFVYVKSIMVGWGGLAHIQPWRHSWHRGKAQEALAVPSTSDWFSDILKVCPPAWTLSLASPEFSGRQAQELSCVPAEASQRQAHPHLCLMEQEQAQV
jgi:hypothetical protein